MYAYNQIISCRSGDISQEVIKDPALDEIWGAAKQDKDKPGGGKAD